MLKNNTMSMIQIWLLPSSQRTEIVDQIFVVLAEHRETWVNQLNKGTRCVGLINLRGTM